MLPHTSRSTSIPPSLAHGVVRPINHRALAYHPGAPIACQSSDKMDFQLSQGSQVGSSRMEGGRTCAAPLPLPTSVCCSFLPSYLPLWSAPVPLLSPLSSCCFSHLLARATWHENPRCRCITYLGGGEVWPQQTLVICSPIRATGEKSISFLVGEHRCTDYFFLFTLWPVAHHLMYLCKLNLSTFFE